MARECHCLPHLSGNGIEDLDPKTLASLFKLLSSKEIKSERSKEPGRFSTKPENVGNIPAIATTMKHLDRKRPKYRTRVIVPSPKVAKPKTKVLNHLGETVVI